MNDYRDDIDGLRAIAVLAVLLYHAFPSLFPGGFVGVDIFFTISGLLITKIIVNDIEKNRFSIQTFYARRIRRIFPALGVVLLASILMGKATLFHFEYRELSREILGGATFISNIQFWKQSGYFDQMAEQKPLLHLWSLGLEEQFYFIWPLILYFCLSLKKTTKILIPLLSLASFIACLALTPSHASFSFYMLPTRFWELALGGGLVLFERPYRLFQKSLSPFIGFSCIVLSFIFINQKTPFPGYWAILPVIGSICILASYKKEAPLHRLLSHPFLTYIGKISYPLYLWHWPLFAFSHVANDSQTTSYSHTLILCAFSFLLASLTYHLVEMPLRFGRLKTVPAWSIATIIFVIGFSAKFTRFEKMTPSYELTTDLDFPDLTHNESCPAEMDKKERLLFCRNSKGKDQESSVALIGDSHAQHLFPGFSRLFKEEGLLFLGHPSCPVMLGETQGSCKKKFDAILDYLVHSPIKKIFISSYASYIPDNTISANREEARRRGELLAIHGHTDSLTKERLFKKGFEDFVKALTNAHKQVFILKDIPELPFLPKKCIPTKGLFLRNLFKEATLASSCQISLEEAQRQHMAYDNIINTMASKYKNISTINIKETLCPNALCSVIREDILLYRDADHLSERGSIWLTKQLKTKRLI